MAPCGLSQGHGGLPLNTEDAARLSVRALGFFADEPTGSMRGNGLPGSVRSSRPRDIASAFRMKVLSPSGENCPPKSPLHLPNIEGGGRVAFAIPHPGGLCPAPRGSGGVWGGAPWSRKATIGGLWGLVRSPVDRLTGAFMLFPGP